MATSALVFTILGMVTSSTHEKLVIGRAGFPYKDVDLIRAYCRLVQNSRTYRLFKLEHMCVVNVKVFDQKVKNGHFS
jgi:hypothetical protein